jgi:putative peptidoglycan lipid II flippase
MRIETTDVKGEEWKNNPEISTAFDKATGSSSRLFLLRIVGISLGIIRLSLLGYYFGTSRSIEAFFGATALLVISSRFLQSGAFSSVFLPVFLESQSKDKKIAWQSLSNLFNLTTLIGVFLWLVMFSTAPWIAKWLVPGFDHSSEVLIVQLFRIISPVILFSTISSLSISILNATKRFSLPRYLGLLSSILDIGLIVILIPKIGIYALGVGYLIGNVFELILLLSTMYRMGYRHRLILKLNDPMIYETYRMVRPFFLRMIILQLTSFFSVSIISFLPAGSYAIYRYASDLIRKLNNLLNKPIETVSFTYITEKTVKHDFESALRRLTKALKITLLITIAPTFIIFLTSKQIIDILLNRGSFDPASLIPLATVLEIFGLGLFLNGTFELLSKTFISLKRTVELNFISIIQQAILLFLIFLLSKEWGLIGAVVASPLSTLFVILLLGGVLLYHRFPILKEVLDKSFLKILLAAFIAYGISFSFSTLFLKEALPIIKIIIISVSYGSIYLTICWIVKLDEFKLIVQKAFRIQS